MSGSSTVSGRSVPNSTPNNNCITIFDCGADGICDPTVDTPIGTGSTDAQGNFTVTVMPPLVAFQRIFAQDTCNDLTGPVTLVIGPVPAPMMSSMLIGVLVSILAGVGALAVRRVRTDR